MVEVTRGAIVWTSGLSIDADGSPHAYAPWVSGLPALDYLANAGRPGNWYGIVCNTSGVPIIQGSEDPAPGYYVSTTALVDRSKRAEDPRRYVDSETVPYVSMPPELRTWGAHVGDLAMVCYGDKQCGAIVADISPHGHYGEGSIALAESLGIPGSPKHGGIDNGVQFLIFPKSSSGWPKSLDFIQNQAGILYTAWKGSDESETTSNGGTPVQAVRQSD